MAEAGEVHQIQLATRSRHPPVYQSVAQECVVRSSLVYVCVHPSLEHAKRHSPLCSRPGIVGAQLCCPIIRGMPLLNAKAPLRPQAHDPRDGMLAVDQVSAQQKRYLGWWEVGQIGRAAVSAGAGLTEPSPANRVHLANVWTGKLFGRLEWSHFPIRRERTVSLGWQTTNRP